MGQNADGASGPELGGDCEFPDTSVTHLQAALLVDSSGRTLSATECPGSHTLNPGRIVGRDWRELFSEFEEIEIESESAPDTSFFVSTGKDKAAYRTRKWGANPAQGAGSGHFILVEGIGDPAAVRELAYRERMVSLGQIGAGVAHEVNNPLTTISGWLQILLCEADEGEKRRAPLELMNEEVARIARIIHRLLAFGRRTPDEQQLVRVNRLLSDVLALVEYQIRNDNIKVVTDFCPNLPLVMGDPNQLKQVFLNVIVNARQAMPNGGILTITTRTLEDGSVEIALGDTGCGMAADVAEKIFDPFYTTKGDKGGSGIGLFLCRGIVKDHGGTLAVSSRPGEGSCFIVALPGASEQESAGTSTLAEMLGGAGAAQRTSGAAPESPGLQ